MKKKLFFMVLASMFAVAAMTGCNNEKEDPNNEQEVPGNDLPTEQIEYKITDIQSNFTISIGALAKKITIDWGDGSNKYEYTPTSPTDTVKITHAYTVGADKVIQISTEGLTGLLVNGNGYIWNEIDNIRIPKYTTELNFGRCSNLLLLYLEDIPKASADVRKLDALKSLITEHMFETTQFDVSKNVNLIYLDLDDVGLTSLDVSNNLLLEDLAFEPSSASVDVSKNTKLKSLFIVDTALVTLDVSKNTALTFLAVYGQLQSLDVSHNTALTKLNCSDNQLSASALNALFTSLPTRTPSDNAEIDIYDNPGAASCDTSIATDKGWKVSGNW